MQSLRSPPPAAVLAILVAIVLLAAGGTLAMDTFGPASYQPVQTPQELVEPAPEENVLWPYTSRARTPTERTLALNMVVRGDPDKVRFYLSERIGARWNETEEEWRDVSVDEGPGVETVERNGTILAWGNADGATRYTYVHNHSHTSPTENDSIRRPHLAQRFLFGQLGAGAEGRWIDESYQLHDGTYFGNRYHLRVYESPFEDDEWVAIQAHSEHWDWFRLRHTVDGIQGAQTRVEAEFMNQPFVDDVWRMYVGNDESSDSDGWATVVTLRDIPTPRPASVGQVLFATVLTGVLVGGRVRAWIAERRVVRRTAAARRRVESEHGRRRRSTASPVLHRIVETVGYQQTLLAFKMIQLGLLFVVLFGLYVAVRAGGIALETNLAIQTPRIVAVSLWVVLALGLPTAAYLLGRYVDPVQGFVFAAAGLGTAFVVDYGLLGVDVLPIEVAIHRASLAIGIGLIAAGATHAHSPKPLVNRAFGSGVLVWVYMLVAPLVGWI